MLFSSPEFLFLFLPAFLFLYFAVPGNSKNGVLFFASLFFYFTTSGELTAILVLSVLFNYYLALLLGTAQGRTKKLYLFVGVSVNLLPLLYYKYSKFFLSTANDAMKAFGWHASLPTVNPILPIGISFFTFQALSYIADIYMRRVTPAGHLIDFGMYHSCFPQLIAGPIVRYEEIRTQVHRRAIRLGDVYNGVTQFCLGLSKKVILADTMGFVADRIFKLPFSSLTSSAAWIGVFAYTLQIYFDFSGYSDMAIGLGRILGFWYPENFNQPYRSCSITEFWRRWHMTLSRWFRDYVYIPLGGNRSGTARTLFNLFIVFVLCGLWHGAAYTFVVWGLYHGALLIAERLTQERLALRVPAILRWSYAMLAVMVGWVFFRSESLAGALAYLRTMFSFRDLSLSNPVILSTMTMDKVFYMLAGMLFSLAPYQWFTRRANNRYVFHPALAVCLLAVAVLAVIMMSVNGFSPFIYFRF